MNSADKYRHRAPFYVFYVMAILAHAKALEAQGRDIIHLEIGKPDFFPNPSTHP